MEYIEIKDGIVVRHFCTNTPPTGSQYREVKSFGGSVGMPIKYLTSDFQKKPTEQLVAEKVITDNRGTYYHKETLARTNVVDYNQSIPEGYTSATPLTDVTFQLYDEATNSFIVDEEREQEYQDSIALEEKIAFLASNSYKFVTAVTEGTGIPEEFIAEWVTVKNEVRVLQGKEPREITMSSKVKVIKPSLLSRIGAKFKSTETTDVSTTPESLDN